MSGKSAYTLLSLLLAPFKQRQTPATPEIVFAAVVKAGCTCRFGKSACRSVQSSNTLPLEAVSELSHLHLDLERLWIFSH